MKAGLRMALGALAVAFFLAPVLTPVVAGPAVEGSRAFGVAPQASSVSALILTEVPAGPSVGSPEPCGPGSRVVRREAGGETRVLSGSLTACDPALDAPAERLVFRGRATDGAPWRIWEVDPHAGEGAPTPLTSGAVSCRRPTFLTDGVAAVCEGDLLRIDDDSASEQAAGPVRLTSSGGAIESAVVVPDGRLLLETRDAEGRSVLLTAQPDGTWATRWRDAPVPGLQAVRPLPPDGLLLTTSAVSTGSGVDVDSEAEAGLWRGSLRDPFAPLRRLGPGSGLDGPVRDPAVLPAGGVLVAYRPSSGEPFRIGRIDAAPDAGPDGSDTIEEVVRTAGHALQPLALAPRPEDTVLPGIVKPELNTGYLVLFDAARSDEPELADVGREEIAAVRIFPWGDGPRGDSAIDLEPAADGSLHLEVPADRPYGMALVGADGALLEPTGGPFWVRPNERRACMGCHVSRRYAPPNVRPEALHRPPRWVGWGAERRGPRSEFEEGSH